MSENRKRDATEKFEKALKDAKQERYNLRLFIAGNSSKSIKAIELIREFCENQLEGRYNLEVIDIYQQPELAREEQILATPTLIKTLPPPLRRLIGNLSSMNRILVGLNLEQIEDDPLE